MNSKKWCIFSLLLCLILLLVVTTLTAYIDPFFHYHAPQKTLSYPINSERYQNYGILKNFSYDTIITGSSMSQNFRTSECDALFQVTSVKTTLAGGTLLEFHEMLKHAISSNPNLHTIFWGLDTWLLFEDKDAMREGEIFPTYLYDDSLCNDVEYVLNKHILIDNTLNVLDYTKEGNTTTSFDEYSFWANHAVFDKEYVLSNYVRSQKIDVPPPAYMYYLENAQITVEQNILPLISQNPDIQFYFFFTPYSILSMDGTNQQLLLDLEFQACSLISQMLLEYDNVHLFSFFNDYETITNLDNYYDTIHYSDSINSLMLQRMAEGEYALTKENYMDHWQEVSAYYLAYDYDALFQ